MKKLMIAASAVALAFGLRADVTLPIGESFNGATEIPAKITTPGESSISSTAYSFSQENAVGAPDMFRKTDANENLNIKTAFNAPAYWEVLDTGYENNGQLYFDSLVKFTACDEAPADADISGAKIVVWIKEDDSGDTVTKTLMVTAGKLDGTTIARQDYECGTPDYYNIAGDTDWCRLTIKAVADVSSNDSYIPGFVVFVNGKSVEIKDGPQIGVAREILAQNMKPWYDSNHLFPSLVAQDTMITKVGFAGQGAVDDLVFTVSEPTASDTTIGEFAKDTLAEIATVGDVPCTDVAAINAAIAEAATGTTVTLLDTVTGDLEFPQSKRFTLNLGGKILAGGITVNGTLTITGNGKVTGSVMGVGDYLLIEGGTFDDTVTIVDGEISGGLFATENNEIETLNEFAKIGYAFKDNEAGYFELYEAENGTADKPWLIKTQADFENKMKFGIGPDGKGVCFKLADDIALDGEWKGIGAFDAKDNLGKTDPEGGQDIYKENAFQGIFDGNGKTISGLVLQRGDYVGFFGSTYGATVKNLKISLGNADGWGLAENGTEGSKDDGGTVGVNYGGGVICGVSVGSTFENCETVATDDYKNFVGTKAIGGIIGYANNGTTVKGCVNRLNLSTGNEKCAGIIAIAQATGTYAEFGETANVNVDGCTNNGNVACTNSGKTFVAGLVGYGDTAVTFKGANVVTGTLTQAGGEASSVAAPNGGSIVVADGATFTVPAGNKTTIKNGKGVDGILFATVSDGVATLIKSAAVAAAGTVKVMAYGASVTLNADETIIVDQTFYAPSVTAAAGCKVTKSGEGPYTYTCVALPAITTVELATTEVEYGTEVAPAATVKDADGNVIDPANYDLALSKVAPWAVGDTVTVTATAKAQGSAYAGSASASFTVVAKVVDVTVTVDPASATWSDTLKLPTPSVEFSVSGIETTDYDAAWDKELPTENPTEAVVLTYTVTLKGNYSGSKSATFTVTPKTAGPDVPGGEADIDIDGSGNVTVFPKGDTKEVTISGVAANATVTIPTAVEKIKGVDPDQVMITYTGADAGATTYYITSAFTKTGNATDGVTYELNPAGSVLVDGVTVPVTPTVVEADAAEGTVADGAVATKAIPGLTYTLMRATSLSAEKVDVANQKAISGTVSLKDEFKDGKPAAAFYTIEVSK